MFSSAIAHPGFSRDYKEFRTEIKGVAPDFAATISGISQVKPAPWFSERELIVALADLIWFSRWFAAGDGGNTGDHRPCPLLVQVGNHYSKPDLVCRRRIFQTAGNDLPVAIVCGCEMDRTAEVIDGISFDARARKTDTQFVNTLVLSRSMFEARTLQVKQNVNSGRNWRGADLVRSIIGAIEAILDPINAVAGSHVALTTGCDAGAALTNENIESLADLTGAQIAKRPVEICGICATTSTLFPTDPSVETKPITQS